MSRAFKVTLVSAAVIAVSVVATACGTERISVPKSAGPLYEGAVLFNQRCSGCHSLSYAATYGSAANVRTAQYNNGPNFNIRCERPVTRVLYAIENGGFSGAIMPQNVVVGQQAYDVAEFVATYAGRQAPRIPGVTPCIAQPIGTIPPPPTIAAAATTSPTAPTTSPATRAAIAKKSKTVARARARAKTAKAKHKP